MKKLVLLTVFILLAFTAWGQNNAVKVEDFIGWYITSYTKINIITSINDTPKDTQPIITKINETAIIQFYKQGEMYQYMLISPSEAKKIKLTDLEVFKGL